MIVILSGAKNLSILSARAATPSGVPTALMEAGAQVEGEGNIFVGEHIPPHAMKRVAVNAGDANALPA
jgi:hypothetical protein